ncbi:MAG: ArsR/SmtB family transcription factor [Stenotrophobium sp.]
MVELKDSTFAALANATRRDILARLAGGEATVSELADAYAISLNAVSKHVMTLEQAGLVTRRVDWRTHYICLNPEPLRAAHEWLDFYRAFWENKLDALEKFLARNKGAQHVPPNPAQKKTRRHPR